MRRQLKAFRIVCSSHGNVGFPPKPRRVVASGFSDSFDHPSSTWEEMATSGKPVSILGHVGPSTIMKTKPFPPNIYCCTCVCSLEGNFWLRCGQEAMWPQGHRAHNRMPQRAGSCPDDTWARRLLSHTPGRARWEWWWW